MSHDGDDSPVPVAAAAAGYFKTTTHNYVSRNAQIDGAKQVEIRGRSIIQEGVRIRGDLAVVRIGRYCEIKSNSVLEPPSHPLDPSKRIPLVIGSHSHIGTNCHIDAAAIGSMVWIGNGVRLGPRVIVKDNCIIEDGVHLGADTVVPPFTRITANDPLRGTELPASMAAHMQEVSLDRYHDFKLEQRDLQ
jgi:dynactin 5